MDPHKKTFLTLKDWQNSFEVFTLNDHLIIDFKTALQLYFYDVQSAYAYF